MTEEKDISLNLNTNCLVLEIIWNYNLGCAPACQHETSTNKYINKTTGIQVQSKDNVYQATQIWILIKV